MNASMIDNQNFKQISQSTINVPSAMINESRNLSGSRTDINNMMKPSYGPVIRTPGSNQQKQIPQPNNLPLGNVNNSNNFNNQMLQSPPPAPIYQPAMPGNQTPPSNQRPYDISKTVTSIVDNWEADLAKHVRRRPSGQFESCM